MHVHRRWTVPACVRVLGSLRQVTARMASTGGPTGGARFGPSAGSFLGRARVVSVALAVMGLVGVLVSGSLVFEAWYARWTWVGSEEYARMERQLADALPRSAESPSEASQSPRPESEGRTPARAVPAHPSGVRTTDPRGRPGPAPTGGGGGGARPGVAPSYQGVGPAAPGGRGAETVRAVRAELRFLDTPEPGAHAVLAVTVSNRSGVRSPAVVLSVPVDWFDRYDIIGAIPPVLDDRVQDDGRRYFDFPGATPGGDTTLELHVVASGDDVGVPRVRVALREGGSLGELQAELTGAPPRPGPVRALSVPRLGIRTGVVDAAWEPPPFVAGQIIATAALGEGNSVLVGHRAGQAGEVFASLPVARLGDEVVAASRGVDQRYIVSMIRILRGDDTTPIGPTETPRLTLMTCVGAWNPLTADYSHRLWVIAEPPDLARATLAATVAQAGQAATTSTSRSEAARLRTDAARARAALSVLDARRPGRP